MSKKISDIHTRLKDRLFAPPALGKCSICLSKYDTHSLPPLIIPSPPPFSHFHLPQFPTLNPTPFQFTHIHFPSTSPWMSITTPIPAHTHHHHPSPSSFSILPLHHPLTHSLPALFLNIHSLHYSTITTRKFAWKYSSIFTPILTHQWSCHASICGFDSNGGVRFTRESCQTVLGPSPQGWQNSFNFGCFRIVLGHAPLRTNTDTTLSVFTPIEAKNECI